MRRLRLDGLYGQLDPDERLRLVVEANARDDEREADRLFASCPTVRLIEPEPEFARAYETATLFTLFAVSMLEPPLAKLALLESLARAAAFAAETTAHAAALAVWQRCELPLQASLTEAVFAETATAAGWLPDVLQRLIDNLRTTVASVAHGWEQVAQEQLGMPLLTLLAAFSPDARPAVAAALEWEPDPAAAADLASTWSAAWAWKLGRGPKPQLLAPPDQPDAGSADAGPAGAEGERP